MANSSDFSINLLYQALDEKRRSHNLTWTMVAKEIEQRFTKVSPSTIKGIRDKQAIEGDGVLQMLLWLGRSPESFVPGFKAGNEHDLTVPQNGVLRFDVQATFRLIDARRRQQAITWEAVAGQIDGISAGSLRRFEKGGRTSFPVIVRIARWLDVPVQQLTREDTW